MSFSRTIIIILLALLFAGCRRQNTSAPSAPLLFVSIAPQREAAQRIAGEHWQVETLLPPGGSPESYSPDAQTLTRLSTAKLYFTIGVPMENAVVSKIRQLNPRMEILDGTKGMAVAEFDNEVGDGDDPHVWLSIPNMRQFAENVAAALASADGAHAEQYLRGAEEYTASLDALDRKIAAQLSPHKGRALLAYHPAFGYFARRYGMRQLAVEREGKEPNGGYLAMVIETARRDRVPAVFVQTQSNPKPAQTLAQELDCKIELLDPLPQSYLHDMEAMANIIAKAYANDGN